MHLEWNEHLKWKTDFITNLLKLGLCSNTTHLTQLFVLLMTVMLEKNFYNSKYVKRIHEGPGFRIPDSSFPDSSFLDFRIHTIMTSGFQTIVDSGFQSFQHQKNCWIPDSLTWGEKLVSKHQKTMHF